MVQSRPIRCAVPDAVLWARRLDIEHGAIVWPGEDVLRSRSPRGFSPGPSSFATLLCRLLWIRNRSGESSRTRAECHRAPTWLASRPQTRSVNRRQGAAGRGRRRRVRDVRAGAAPPHPEPARRVRRPVQLVAGRFASTTAMVKEDVFEQPRSASAYRVPSRRQLRRHVDTRQFRTGDRSAISPHASSSGTRRARWRRTGLRLACFRAVRRHQRSREVASAAGCRP